MLKPSTATKLQNFGLLLFS